MRRAIAGTAVGNFMESYDFSLYSLVATTLAHTFYPGAGSGNLIATFGTLAVAFVIRPLGGIIFGPLGDRIGRKPVLLMTIGLMTFSATATGLLPGYRSIGVWAPILLVAVRLCQGLSTGGEYAGAMTYIVETAPDRRRGKLAGFLPMGTLSGNVTAVAVLTGLQLALPPDDMARWGWRLPFFLALPLGLTAVILRLRLGETLGKASEQMPTERGQFAQLRQTIIGHWRPLLVCFGLEQTICSTNYMLSGYVPTYLKAIVRLSATEAMLMVLLALGVAAILVVFVAGLSDRVGVKPLIAAGCALLLIGSIPAFLLLGTGSDFATRAVGVLIIGSALLCLNSIEPATLPALFPPEVRYGGVSIGYNLAVSAYGGTTPLVAQSLISATGNTMMPAFVLMFAGFIGTTTLFFTPEVAGRPLPVSEAKP
ncbi:MFS transporter [Candidatus Mycobacterium wuenschmannii]|nr:MFS transporter [Candidatus Mycobacterium wuenschmannii]